MDSQIKEIFFLKSTHVRAVTIMVRYNNNKYNNHNNRVMEDSKDLERPKLDPHYPLPDSFIFFRYIYIYIRFQTFCLSSVNTREIEHVNKDGRIVVVLVVIVVVRVRNTWTRMTHDCDRPTTEKKKMQRRILKCTCFLSHDLLFLLLIIIIVIIINQNIPFMFFDIREIMTFYL